MNKRIQISLILMITIILLLGLTIPGMAWKNGQENDCFIRVLTIDQNGKTSNRYKLYGEFSYYWDATDRLVNECTGIIPFGEKINPTLSYAYFDDWCSLNAGDCDDGIYSFENFGGTWYVYDPENDTSYIGDYSSLILQDTGDFTFTKIYTP